MMIQETSRASVLDRLLAPDFKAEKARQEAAGEDWRDEPWRQHFSNNAQDLIQVQRAFVGEFLLQDILTACFKASPNSAKINAPTVERVLQEMCAESRRQDKAEARSVGDFLQIGKAGYVPLDVYLFPEDFQEDFGGNWVKKF